MQSKNFSIGLTLSLALAFTLALLTGSTPATAQTETVLFSFDETGNGGADPNGGVVRDTSGNLYGTTYGGGGEGCSGEGCGLVFELMPGTNGWTETVIHNFNDNKVDGTGPVAGLVFDPAGNLYGTTRNGGSAGLGTVFKLSPQADGSWKETILHSFLGKGADGAEPYASVILDAAGNVYGTTIGDGLGLCGNVYELSQVGGAWKEKMLHSFAGTTDGCGPMGGLVMDSAGDLYGTTEGGNERIVNDDGTVYELIPQSNGTWKEKILANFPSDGSGPQQPEANLIFDAAGNLYSTSSSGGHNGRGTVFELLPKPGGGWTPKILYSFLSTLGGGQSPTAGVVMDAAGNLYSTTSTGGTTNESMGTAFKLSPGTGFNWVETVLYDFTNGSVNGATPTSGLILDSAGNVYGETGYGGAFLDGTVYMITQ